MCPSMCPTSSSIMCNCLQSLLSLPSCWWGERVDRSQQLMASDDVCPIGGIFGLLSGVRRETSVFINGRSCLLVLPLLKECLPNSWLLLQLTCMCRDVPYIEHMLHSQVPLCQVSHTGEKSQAGVCHQLVKSYFIQSHMMLHLEALIDMLRGWFIPPEPSCRRLCTQLWGCSAHPGVISMPSIR